jgi:hypothetical protein
MLMPKAAIHKKDRAPFWKRQIWTARQISAEQAKSKAQCVCSPPHSQLWLGVTAAYGTHIA